MPWTQQICEQNLEIGAASWIFRR